MNNQIFCFLVYKLNSSLEKKILNFSKHGKIYICYHLTEIKKKNGINYIKYDNEFFEFSGYLKIIKKLKNFNSNNQKVVIVNDTLFYNHNFVWEILLKNNNIRNNYIYGDIRRTDNLLASLLYVFILNRKNLLILEESINFGIKKIRNNEIDNKLIEKIDNWLLNDHILFGWHNSGPKLNKDTYNRKRTTILLENYSSIFLNKKNKLRFFPNYFIFHFLINLFDRLINLKNKLFK